MIIHSLTFSVASFYIEISSTKPARTLRCFDSISSSFVLRPTSCQPNSCVCVCLILHPVLFAFVISARQSLFSTKLTYLVNNQLMVSFKFCLISFISSIIIVILRLKAQEVFHYQVLISKQIYNR